MNNNIRIVHLYLCSKQPFEKEYSAYTGPFAFGLIYPTHFQIYSGYHISCIAFSETVPV